MPQPPPSLSVPVKLGLSFLAMCPCLPGLIFLGVGFVTDPHHQPRDLSSAGQIEYARTWERTRGLYLAGGLVLIAGTFGTAAVIWKLARLGRLPDEAPDAPSPEKFP